jgi:hypothetical protein
MACGTGKTLVALWAAEQETPKTVLVLVPSLTLLQQTLREWSEQTSWGNSFSYICVCSDPTVGLKDSASRPTVECVAWRLCDREQGRAGRGHARDLAVAAGHGAVGRR